MVSSGLPPDDGRPLARQFDETMARARATLASMRRAGDELAGAAQTRPTRRRERVIDDLLEDLGAGLGR
jgi:hypothetical protein